jgi:N utilization substance protein B
VAGLAKALELDISEVQAVLRARSEPDAPDEFVDAEVSLEVAATLGREVFIEPRDLALEALYQWETNGSEPVAVSGRARRLVDGVLERREQLDHLIETASEHWSVARMPVIDRSILRIGLYELLEEEDVPTAVVVSEAVRLAKTYSTERSGSFVNGVLATLANEVRG